MGQKKQKLSKQLVADVISAVPLNESDKQQITQLLSDALDVKNVVLNEKTDSSLLGGFQIQIGSYFIDLSFDKKLSLVKQALAHHPPLDFSQKKLESFLTELKKNDSFLPNVESIGKVASVKDNVAHITGLDRIKAGELIRFKDNNAGIVFNVNRQFADVVLLDNDININEGDIARRTNDVLKVPVGKALLGRVVNALGMPVDGKGEIQTKLQMPIEASAPSIIDRQPVCKPFQTGIKVIDALIPIGLGQRELIIGDRQTGKTTLLIDSILNQKQHNDSVSDAQKIYCIYVAIGQKQSSVANVVHTLEKTGAMDYTCVVCANASDTAAQQYLAPFTATTIAEYFRDNGMNAVVFYDDLSKHANAYRQLSLLLRRPPGREAYPGDIFYLHSRLLERSAMMSSAKGGGSLTAIPVIETLEGDVSAYVPTNVISITDGQIFLDANLFHQNIRPAVSVGLSVSRVGSKAQKPLIAKLSSSMKLQLSQYREMLSFAQIASDLDITAQTLLQQGARLTESLKQKPHAPLSFCDEFLTLYTISKGFFNNVAVEDITDFESKMLAYIHEAYPDIADIINSVTKDLSRAQAQKIDEVTKEALTYCISEKGSA